MHLYNLILRIYLKRNNIIEVFFLKAMSIFIHINKNLSIKFYLFKYAVDYWISLRCCDRIHNVSLPLLKYKS